MKASLSTYDNNPKGGTYNMPKLEFKLSDSKDRFGGFETETYDIITNEEMTVIELVQAIIDENKESWGYIKIYNPLSSPLTKNFYCKYEYGSMIRNELEQFSDKKVTKATAKRDWNSLDCTIYIDLSPTEFEQLVR